MSIREYDFIAGVETSAIPDPALAVDDADLATYGQIKDEFTSRQTFENKVADLTALKAIPSASRFDNQLVSVEISGEIVLFFFDSASSATGDDIFVVTPDAGTGRWIRQKRNLPQILDEGVPAGFASKIDFVGANVGVSFSSETATVTVVGGSGSTSGSNSVELLLQHGEIANSAYASGLSVVDGTSNTEEGYTLNPEIGVDFDGVAVFDTTLILQIVTVGGSTVDCFDTRDRSAEFLNGDVLQVFRLETIDGVDTYINTGIEKTLTANSSFSSGITTLTLNVTDLLVDDVMYKKNQITKEISYVDAGAGDSFVAMTKNSVEVTDSIGGSLSNPTGLWDLQQTTGSFTDRTSISGNLPITGTFTQVATGNHYPTAASNWSTSNYVPNSVNFLNLTPTQDFSFSLWIYASGITSNHHLILVKPTGTSVANNTGWLILIDPAIKLFIGTTNVGTLGTLTASAWSHIVITHLVSSGQKYIYINGTQNNMGTNTIQALSPTTGGLAIGGDGAGTSLRQLPSASRLVDLQYYNRVLTPTEVSTLYNSGNGLAGADTFSVIERYGKDALDGQILKSKVTVPTLSANNDITVSAHGVITR